MLSNILDGYDYNKNYKSKEFTIKNNDTTSFIELSQTQITTSSGQKGKVIIIQDVTAEKEAIKENENMQKQVFHSTKLASLGELAAGVAHEINNPLMILFGNIEMLDEHLSAKDVHDDFTASTIERQLESVSRITNIVEGLRTYSRKDSNITTSVNINLAIESCVNLIRSIYTKQGIKININYKNPSPYTFGSFSKLQQVIMNLLANAKDAIRNTKEPEINISTYTINDKAIILFEDNGEGIDSSIKDKIFDSFFTTKDVGKGTGLGLSISYAIIESMNGQISVQSTKDEGASFTITLPLIKQ
jgi:signal transduction histidine kinase